MQFIDLKQQYQLYKKEIHAEMDKVLSNASFIKGPVLAEFEPVIPANVGIEELSIAGVPAQPPDVRE